MSVSQPQPLPEAPPARRLTLPFIDTEPLFDVQWGVLLLPLWWWLGIEQFIWPVIMGWAVLKLLHLQQLRIATTPSLRWFAAFLVTVLFSSLFIVETERWFTYVRNLGAFVGGFLVLLLITNRARSWRSIDRTLNIALITVLIAGAAGLLGILGVWQPAIHSLTGALLPASVANTSYGQTVVIRTLGERAWFAGLGNYFRVSGFFLFSNSYSSVRVYAVPFLVYKISQQRRGLAKILLVMGILLLLINLVYSTGRVATLGLLGGAIFFGIYHSRLRRVNRVLFSLGLTLLIILVLFSAVVELAGGISGKGLIDYTVEAVDAFVFARGPGSFLSRFGVYEQSLRSIAERPLLGWGTERDHPALRYPMGSHSEYLAALYRQGVLGFVAFVGLLWSIWRTTRPPSGARAIEPPGTLLRYGRWFMVTSLINSVMTDPAIDSSVFVLQWLFIALLVATAQLVHRQREHEREQA